MRFDQLDWGDLFNTKTARWVKVSDTEAICVMSGVHPIGEVSVIPADFDVIVLWTAR